MPIEGPHDPDQLRRKFDADGFVKIEQLLIEQQLQQVENELARYLREVAPNVPASDIVYERDTLPDGSRAVRNLWRMEEHSQFFGEMSRTLGLTWIGPLVNGDAVSMGVELFAKPAL